MWFGVYVCSEEIQMEVSAREFHRPDVPADGETMLFLHRVNSTGRLPSHLIKKSGCVYALDGSANGKGMSHAPLSLSLSLSPLHGSPEMGHDSTNEFDRQLC